MAYSIPIGEVNFHHGSFADPNGRLFFWRGGLYRALSPSYGDVALRLRTDGLLTTLVDKHFVIESGFTDFSLDGFQSVVKHRTVPYITYANEWSPSMLRDAALLMIDLESELAGCGLTVMDAHPWNILFDSCTPIFVDLCGFGKQETSDDQCGPLTWKGFDSFRRFFLFPLLAMQAGLERLSRLSFLDQRGIAADEVRQIHATEIGHKKASRQLDALYSLAAPVQIEDATDGFQPVRKFRSLLARRSRPEKWSLLHAKRHEFLQLLRTFIEEIEIPIPRGDWADYYQDRARTDEKHSTDEDSEKLTSVRAILDASHAETVLDVGANTGFFSRVALGTGATVASIDSEVSCVDELYRRARKDRLRLTPAVIDVKNPTPPVGPAHTELPSCLHRLRSDVVLALGITHHLAHKSLMTFEQMISTFSDWTKRSLVIEYIPPNDQHVRGWNLESRPWYTFEGLCHEIDKQFTIVSVLDSFPFPRKLVLANKKD